jgi:hypothetical protein
LAILAYAALSVPLLLRRAPTATPVGLLGLALAVHLMTDGQVVRAFVASATLFAFLGFAAGVVDDTPVHVRAALVAVVGAPVVGSVMWALGQHVRVTGLFWWTVGLACLLAAYAVALAPPVAEPDYGAGAADDGPSRAP